MESLFNKVAGLEETLEETPTLVFSCKYCEVFKNTYLKNIYERLVLTLQTSMMVFFKKLVDGFQY